MYKYKKIKLLKYIHIPILERTNTFENHTIKCIKCKSKNVMKITSINWQLVFKKIKPKYIILRTDIGVL